MVRRAGDEEEEEAPLWIKQLFPSFDKNPADRLAGRGDKVYCVKRIRTARLDT